MTNDVWIKITFNSKERVEGKEEMIEELRQVCVVQERKLWYASFDSGSEFFAEVLFNTGLGLFIKNVVVPGLEWDAIKYACSKIWSAFSKFAERNDGLDLQTLTLSFNDATVKVNGTLGDNYLFLVKLFQCLPKHWAKFQSIGISDIIKIELPVLPNEHNVELLQQYCTEDEETPENCLWYIRYQLGLESAYYSPALMKLL